MTVKSTATFDVPAAILYRTFLDTVDLSRMTRSPCSASPQIGGDWSIFNGSVRGKFLEVDQDRRIVQTWRFSNWNDSDESKVTISFTSEGPACTKITVEQSGIPSHDRFGNPEQHNLCAAGWEEKYWSGISKFLGYPRNRD